MDQNDILDNFKDQPSPAKRPVVITVMTILGFIGIAAVIAIFFTDNVSIVGHWYPPYLAVSALIGFICMLGFWNMKKWALFAYIIFFVTNQVVIYIMGIWNFQFGFIVPIIFIGIVIHHYKKLT